VLLSKLDAEFNKIYTNKMIEKNIHDSSFKFAEKNYFRLLADFNRHERFIDLYLPLIRSLLHIFETWRVVWSEPACSNSTAQARRSEAGFPMHILSALAA